VEYPEVNAVISNKRFEIVKEDLKTDVDDSSPSEGPKESKESKEWKESKISQANFI
jgi:hypothetical protein